MVDKVDVVRRLVAACYSADETAMREILGPDFVPHAPGGGTGSTDGWVALAKHMAAGVPDSVTEIEDIFASGDRVAVRLTNTGTHTGELHGMPPTSRQLVTGAIEIYRFDGDRVVECWGQYDMSQLFASQ
jgi:predicted ester cyclase